MTASPLRGRTPCACDTCLARSFSICHALGPDELHRLGELGSTRTIAAGATFVTAGEPISAVFTVTQGVAIMYQLLSNGRRQILHFLTEGDFVGLVGEGDYGFSVQAVTPVRICRFPRAGFRKLVGETPKLEKELLSRAYGELQGDHAHLTMLGRKSARERVVSFLLDLAERGARQGGAPDLIQLAMTRSDIADYLGLTTETVSRTISGLKTMRAIQLLDHGMVRLVARDRLRALAEAG